jgi:hypothetical protein
MSTMVSSYHPSSGAKNTLIVPQSEVIEFKADSYSIEVTFQALSKHIIEGFVHQDDIDDKTKYWKTEELVQQLKGLRDHYARMRDHWKDKDGGLSLALKYSMKVATIKEILDTMEAENYIWED